MVNNDSFNEAIMLWEGSGINALVTSKKEKKEKKNE